jgi:hypothetical protein
VLTAAEYEGLLAQHPHLRPPSDGAGVFVAAAHCRACPPSASAPDLAEALAAAATLPPLLVGPAAAAAAAAPDPLPPPLSTELPDGGWAGCHAGWDDAAAVRRHLAAGTAGASRALVVGSLLGDLDGPAPGPAATAAASAAGAAAVVGALPAASWLAADADRFSTGRLPSPSVCVALIAHHPGPGRAASRGPAATSRRRAAAAGPGAADLLLRAVRAAARRLPAAAAGGRGARRGQFASAYVVDDGGLPEEAGRLRAALAAVPYEGLATAGRLGGPAGNPYVAAVLQARDAEVW